MKSKKPLIAGIDQSFTSTGLVILDHQSNITHDCIISSDKEQSIYSRAIFVANEIQKIIKEFEVTGCVIEGLGFAASGDATRNLAGLQFVIYDYLHKIPDVNIIVVPPTTLKKFATDSGKAKKQQMLESVESEFQEYFKENYKKTKGLYDIVDGYWLARYGLKIHGEQ